MEQFYAFVAAHPIIALGLNSLGAAMLVDVFAFLRFKDWNDATTWSFKLASLRWLQGLVGGLASNAITAAGLSVTSLAIYWLW